MKCKCLLLILLTFAAACGPGSDGGSQTPGPRLGAGNSGGGGHTPGPADTGGANGVKGKLFESYSQKVETLPLFRNSLADILTRVSNVLPELAGEMLYVIREKSWMFVPVPLSQIPPNYLGVHVKHEVLDQFALQDLQEVYVDNKLFSEMTLIDQTTLVVHEMLMGIRQMEFANQKDTCVAVASRLIFKDSKAYKAERERCFSKINEITSGLEDHIQQRNIVIGKEDYKRIRPLTIKIMSEIENMSANELKALVFENLKRRY